MVELTTSGGITISDIYKAFFGASWTSFPNENGGGLRALDATTRQAQSSNEGSHS